MLVVGDTAHVREGEAVRHVRCSKCSKSRGGRVCVGCVSVGCVFVAQPGTRCHNKMHVSHTLMIRLGSAQWYRTTCTPYSLPATT